MILIVYYFVRALTYSTTWDVNLNKASSSQFFINITINHSITAQTSKLRNVNYFIFLLLSVSKHNLLDTGSIFQGG